MTDLAARASNPVVGKAITAVPNLVKLGYRLLRDPRVPSKHKAFLGAALAYVVAPVDLIPDFIPFVGQADDLLILAFALNAIFDAAGEAIVHEHWDGTGDVLEIVAGVIAWGASLVPWPMRRAMKRILRGF
ncbi:MAG: YkvA family protein [Acidimicrobiia bacterium]|nr:YkvA family protein [Acidimicrobiia bacterium]